MLTRQQLRTILLLVSLVIATVAVRFLLTGGLATISLRPAPPLTGIVSQSLGHLGASKSLPVPGEDFNLKDIHYFDNKSWVVASVTPTKKSISPALVILHGPGLWSARWRSASRTPESAYRYSYPRRNATAAGPQGSEYLSAACQN